MNKSIYVPLKNSFLEGGEGINIDNYKKYNNASNDTTFLFIGRILWDKGYDEFTKAARKVKVLYPNVNFELLGSLDPKYPKAYLKSAFVKTKKME